MVVPGITSEPLIIPGTTVFVSSSQDDACRALLNVQCCFDSVMEHAN